MNIANAKLIGRFRFLKLIEDHVDKGCALKNRIINLPDEEEKSMRTRLERAISDAKGDEKDFKNKLKAGSNVKRNTSSRLTGTS